MIDKKISEVGALLLIFAFSSEDERDKFEFIYTKYKNLMLKKAHDILGDYMLAEDAVSEAFIRIYKNLDKIEDPESPRSISFVATIVKNTALTLLAKSRKQPIDLFEEDERPEQPDDFDLEESVLTGMTAEGVYEIINRLGDDLKSVFLLKFAHDMSHKDIGKALGITENNVTVRLHRAKKKLFALLVKEGYVHENSAG